MMEQSIKHIMQDVKVLQQTGSLAKTIHQIVFDSRKAIHGTLFFAIKGTASDGHDFIESAIQNGCKAVVAEKFVQVPADVTVIVTENSSLALALAATRFYDFPSKKLKLIGVTGTNGKTTTTSLLFKLFTRLGYSCGLLSTVVNRIGDLEIPATHTTPDPVSLNELLNEMVLAGCTHCFMEVSSHAVHQNRVAGLSFAGGVFTNISHDHLDYHKTFAEYIKVKKSFFDGLDQKAFALTNADDKNGMVMLQNSVAKKVTYSLRSPADFKAKVLENQFSGLVLVINGKEVWTKLIGDFNAYNLLAVYAVSQLLHEDQMEVLCILSDLDAVEGRFQYFRSNSGITAIVDYAHTPDALENVLKTITNIRKGNEQVLTVVGCGGDRDSEKRPKMAEIACKMSDRIIITSDNPRSEDPQHIVNQMMEGVESQFLKKTLTILDRKEAIKTAISLANQGDILLIAGKGHEKYQEIKGVKHDFDDLSITKELFNQLEK
jgi:UDP-N-acetylmuramoyl-L-alanyl-D-glutamate--2,6-diaminopimelate ligase